MTELYRRFARPHFKSKLALSIEQLESFQHSAPPTIELKSASSLPTRHGPFHAMVVREIRTGFDHLVLIRGDLSSDVDDSAVLVRVHSECLTGDLLGSLRCDCGFQLRQALDMIGREKRGVLVYMRGQEGRGIGLPNKLNAYELQDAGLDTVDANVALGLPVDARSFSTAADILRELNINRVRLITNNAQKVADMQRNGIHIVERVPATAIITPFNAKYIYTKRARMGHTFDLA